jgi:hypothetical protein
MALAVRAWHCSGDAGWKGRGLRHQRQPSGVAEGEDPVPEELRKVVKDNVRLGTDSKVMEPKADGERSVLEDLLTPMSLTAYLETEN